MVDCFALGKRLLVVIVAHIETPPQVGSHWRAKQVTKPLDAAVDSSEALFKQSRAQSLKATSSFLDEQSSRQAVSS
jgi:hypothetical protein